MRILSYNIFDCFHASQPFESLAQHLDALDIQTLLINEYRHNEDGQRLTSALRAVGFGHAALGRSAQQRGNNANCNAVFSREPFDVAANCEDFRFVAVRQAGLTLCAYHASPRGVAAVLPEIDAVLAFVDGHDDVLLAGDMNSLAADDRAVLGYDANLGDFSRYTKGDALSFEAIDRLIESGLHDLNVDAKRHTAPTGRGRNVEGDRRVRLDYALGKGSCAVTHQAEVLRGEPFDMISDHYPLLIRPK